MHTPRSHLSGRGSSIAQQIARRGLALLLVVGLLLTSVLFFRPVQARTQALPHETAGQQHSTLMQRRAQQARDHLELLVRGNDPPIIDD